MARRLALYCHPSDNAQGADSTELESLQLKLTELERIQAGLVAAAQGGGAGASAADALHSWHTQLAQLDSLQAHLSAQAQPSSSQLLSKRRRGSTSASDSTITTALSDGEDEFRREVLAVLHSVPTYGAAAAGTRVSQKRRRHRPGDTDCVLGSNSLSQSDARLSSGPFQLSEGPTVKCPCCSSARAHFLVKSQTSILADFDAIYEGELARLPLPLPEPGTAALAELAAAGVTVKAERLALLMLSLHGGKRSAAAPVAADPARERTLMVEIATALLMRRATVYAAELESNACGTLYVLVCRDWEIRNAKPAQLTEALRCEAVLDAALSTCSTSSSSKGALAQRQLSQQSSGSLPPPMLLLAASSLSVRATSTSTRSRSQAGRTSGRNGSKVSAASTSSLSPIQTVVAKPPAAALSIASVVSASAPSNSPGRRVSASASSSSPGRHVGIDEMVLRALQPTSYPDTPSSFVCNTAEATTAPGLVVHETPCLPTELAPHAVPLAEPTAVSMEAATSNSNAPQHLQSTTASAASGAREAVSRARATGSSSSRREKSSSCSSSTQRDQLSLASHAHSNRRCRVIFVDVSELIPMAQALEPPAASYVSELIPILEQPTSATDATTMATSTTTHATTTDAAIYTAAAAAFDAAATDATSSEKNDATAATHSAATAADTGVELSSTSSFGAAASCLAARGDDATIDSRLPLASTALDTASSFAAPFSPPSDSSSSTEFGPGAPVHAGAPAPAAAAPFAPATAAAAAVVSTTDASSSTLGKRKRRSVQPPPPQRQHMLRRKLVSSSAAATGHGFTQSDAFCALLRMGYTAPVFISTEPGRGRCVFSGAFIPRGAFVAEYAGVLVSGTEGDRRHLIYGGGCVSSDDSGSSSVGSYMFFFTHGKRRHCIDATAERPEYGFGRIIAHSRKHPNLRPQVFVVDCVPRVALVAKHDIGYADELFYDYGDKEKSTLAAFEWLESS